MESEGLGTWTGHTAEKLLRILHIQSILCSTVLRNGQKLFWMMDDDSIFPNEAKGEILGRLWKRVLNLYLPKDIHPNTVGFAKPFHSQDIKERVFDDALSYTDLVAGAVQEYFAALKKDSRHVLVKASTGLILRWLAKHDTNLKRINIRLDRFKEDGQYKIGGNLVTFNLTNA